MSTMITFLINGERQTVEAEDNWMWWVARFHALRETDNTGCPPADWDVRDSEGRYINPTDLVQPGTYYLCLKIGAGGSHTNYRRLIRPDRWRANSCKRFVICENTFLKQKQARHRGVRRTLKQTLPTVGVEASEPPDFKHLNRFYWWG